VLVPIGTIFDDLGGLSTLIGNGIQEFGVDTVPAINQLLFDIPTQLVLFGSALFDLIPGVGAASDVSALPDFSALSDVSSLLNPADQHAAEPRRFRNAVRPAGISSMVGTLAADIPTMLLSLIP